MDSWSRITEAKGRSWLPIAWGNKKLRPTSAHFLVIGQNQSRGSMQEDESDRSAAYCVLHLHLGVILPGRGTFT